MTKSFVAAVETVLLRHRLTAVETVPSLACCGNCDGIANRDGGPGIGESCSGGPELGLRRLFERRTCLSFRRRRKPDGARQMRRHLNQQIMEDEMEPHHHGGGGNGGGGDGGGGREKEN